MILPLHPKPGNRQQEKIYLSVEAPEFGLSWALGHYWKGHCYPLPRWSGKSGSGSSSWLGSSEMEPGSFMALFQNKERTVWLVIFFYTRFGRQQKKTWSRIPFSWIHYSSNFAYYWVIAASPQPVNEFLGCFLVPCLENTTVCFWTWYTAWVECESFLQKHVCWGKVKAQKQRCWMRAFFVLASSNKYEVFSS